MNEHLQKCLSSLENLIAIQKDFVIEGKPEADYMHGMLNGLICAHSAFTGDDPNYHSMSRRAGSVRHKIHRKKNK